MASTWIFSRCSSPRAPFNQVVMAMPKPSQSHSGGVIVKPYTGNIAQELQFLTGEKKKKTKPILRLDCHRQPSNNNGSRILVSSFYYSFPVNLRASVRIIKRRLQTLPISPSHMKEMEYGDSYAKIFAV